MKEVRKLFSLMMVLLLAGTMSAWASQASSSKSSKPVTTKSAKSVNKMEVASGKVVSINDGELVLARKRKGKEEQTTFSLTPSTQREGQIAEGSEVSVHYQMENGQRVASMVKTARTHAKAASQKPASKS